MRLIATEARTNPGARESLRRALRPLVDAPPVQATVTADLAALLVALDDPAAAVTVSRVGLQRTTRDAGRARLSAQLGRALLRSGDAAGAVVSLRAALDTAGGARAVWRLWLAQALVKAGDLQEARSVLDGQVLATLDPAQQTRAVRVLVDAEAWDEVQSTIARGQVGADAVARAAKLAARADRTSLATALARTITDPSSRAAALVDVARTRLARDDQPGAVEAARNAVESAPGSLDALSVLARSLQRAGQLAEARDVVREAVERCPDSVEVLSWAVTSAYRLRSWTEAAAFVERLRSLDPWGARVAAARIAVRAGSLDAAAQYEQLRSERPDDPEVARLGGELHQRSSRDPEAYAEFRRALASLPEDAGILLACGRLAAKLGRDAEALQYIDELLSRRPQDDRLLRLQVRVEARQGLRSTLDDLAVTRGGPAEDELVFEFVSGLLEGCDDESARAALELALRERAHREPVIGP